MGNGSTFAGVTSALAFLAVLAATPGAAQGPHTLGDCNRYELRPSSVILNCRDGARVRIRALSASVVEVWPSPDGTLTRRNPSFAVVDSTLGPLPRLRVRDVGDRWRIASGDLVLYARKSPFALSYADRRGRLLGEDARGGAYRWSGQRWSWARRILPAERILGLGEKSGRLVRNGRRYTMWNSDQPCYGTATDPLYKSIPFYLSTRGFGIFLDDTYRTTFDVGAANAGRLTVTGEGGPLIYYVIGGEPKQALDRYTRLTGRPMLPPKWAFGYAQSRGLYTNEALARAVAHVFRQHRIPADIIYQDIGWVKELQDFSWNPRNYPDPVGMLKDLGAEGFKVIVSQDPIISRRNRAQWQAAADSNLLVLDRRTGRPYDMPWPWGGHGSLVDFTSPRAADYWGRLQQKVVDQGVAGFWTDMGEPAWSNLDAPDRLFMQHAAGPHAEIHNVYGQTWDEIVTAQWRKRNPNRRIFQMTRSAFAGMQRFTFGWSGDSGCQENTHDGWSRLADQVRMAQSAALGALAFWSSDISGYCGDITDYAAFAPLYVRWMEFGLFNSLSRVHHNGNWAVEPWQFGTAVEDMVRSAVERRYRLFPYIYTYARKSYDTGLPMIRPLVVDYPGDENALRADTEFLFGDELLVAPIVSAANTRRVYLPPGRWIDYNHPARSQEGGRWITVSAPLGETPLWVRAGSIIPTMPVMQYIHQDSVYPIILEVYPRRGAGRTEFELYEDDGLTYDYETHSGSRTTFRVETTPGGWRLGVAARLSDGYRPPAPRNLLFKLHLPANLGVAGVFPGDSAGAALPRRPLSEVMDYKSDITGWAVQFVDRVLYIKMPDTGESQSLRVKARRAAPAAPAPRATLLEQARRGR